MVDDFLTQKVLQYQMGNVALACVVPLVAEEVFFYLQRRVGRYNDLAADFLVDFYPRIGPLVHRFVDRGLPFQHFLYRTLKWRWMEYRQLQRRERRLHALLGENVSYSVEDLQGVISVVSEGENDLNDEESVWAGLLDMLSDRSGRPSRLLLALLSRADSIDTARVEEFCRRTHTDLAWVEALLVRLRNFSLQRKSQKEELKDRRTQVLVKAWEADKEVERAENQLERIRWKRRARTFRVRAQVLTRRVRAIHTKVTHQEIGRIVGVPKGTVDSGLHYLKQRLTAVYTRSHATPPGDEQRTQEN